MLFRNHRYVCCRFESGPMESLELQVIPLTYETFYCCYRGTGPWLLRERRLRRLTDNAFTPTAVTWLL